MTSIGPKTPTAVTPSAHAEHEQGDDRGRQKQPIDQQDPAVDQGVSAQQPATPDTAIYGELAAPYKSLGTLTHEQMKAYIDTMRGARTL